MENYSNTNRNYIWLFRDVPEWLEQSPNTFHLLAFFARHASRENRSVPWHGENIKINPLEVIVGRFSTSEKTGLTPNQYRYAFKRLLENNLIKTIRTTKRYTIISLCSTSVFFINPVSEYPSDQPSEQPTENHQNAIRVTTNNNDKNEKKESRLEKFEEKQFQSPEPKGLTSMRETIEKLRKDKYETKN